MEQPFHVVIRKALPTFQESELQKLFDHLDAIGVRSDTDLRFVAVEDVIEAIPLIAAKRLVHYLKNSGEYCCHCMMSVGHSNDCFFSFNTAKADLI